MAQRRFHYEQAFEHYLRANRIPYVAVDEAKKALVPAKGNRPGTTRDKAASGCGADGPASLKSFDFVVYGPGRNMLIDVKGRMFGSKSAESLESTRRFESWVTTDDVESLQHWQQLFGPDFEAVFVFAYCLRQQPPDALFEEVFSFGERWYALREVRLADYMTRMKVRSQSWKTVHVPSTDFAGISRPFSARIAHPASHSSVKGLQNSHGRSSRATTKPCMP